MDERAAPDSSRAARPAANAEVPPQPILKERRIRTATLHWAGLRSALTTSSRAASTSLKLSLIDASTSSGKYRISGLVICSISDQFTFVVLSPSVSKSMVRRATTIPKSMS